VSGHDVALVTQAIARADPLDPDCPTHPVPDYLSTIEGGAKELVIDVDRGFLWECMHDDVHGVLEDALAAWRAAGATVVKVDASGLAKVGTLIGTVILGESAALHAAQLRDHADDYTLAMRGRLETSLAIPAATYLDAMRARKPMAEAFCRAVFGRCDALFASVLLDPVPTIAESDFGAPARAVVRRDSAQYAPRQLSRPAGALASLGFRAERPAGRALCSGPINRLERRGWM
jgi:Asp-tRNA(Asn)/Glu-tRNA(Gln) amidotransferase A subunit family amidase